MFAENIRQLHSSLEDLHVSVEKLIAAIQDHAKHVDDGEQILNKLPLLDFYNDDLKRNIEILGDKID
jgi:hypothetical protein